MLKFFTLGVEISHDSPDLEFADCVSITFEFQKNGSCLDTVTQMATHEPVLCPVRQWAALICRIRSYSSSTKDTPVCTVERNGIPECITSATMVIVLRDNVGAIGEHTLGIPKKEVGTH